MLQVFNKGKKSEFLQVDIYIVLDSHSLHKAYIIIGLWKLFDKIAYETYFRCLHFINFVGRDKYIMPLIIKLVIQYGHGSCCCISLYLHVEPNFVSLFLSYGISNE